MPTADVKVANGEWAGPGVHAKLAGVMLFSSTLNQKGSPIQEVLSHGGARYYWGLSPLVRRAGAPGSLHACILSRCTR